MWLRHRGHQEQDGALVCRNVEACCPVFCVGGAKEAEGILEGPEALVFKASKAYHRVLCVCGANQPQGLEGPEGVGVRR